MSDDALRKSVAQDVGLSDALASRLVGDNRGELEADAKQMHAELHPVADDLGGGQRGIGPTPPGMDTLIREAAADGKGPRGGLIP